MPTINQDTGIPSPAEPTETLQTYRSGEVLLPSHKNKRQVTVACIFSVEHVTPYICWRKNRFIMAWIIETHASVHFCRCTLGKMRSAVNPCHWIAKEGSSRSVIHFMLHSRSLRLMKCQPEWLNQGLCNSHLFYVCFWTYHLFYVERAKGKELVCWEVVGINSCAYPIIRTVTCCRSVSDACLTKVRTCWLLKEIQMIKTC